MGKTGSRTNGKRTRAATPPKKAAKAKAKPAVKPKQAVRAKSKQAAKPKAKQVTKAKAPARALPKTRVAKTKPSARKVPSPKPKKAKSKARLSLVPPPQPAKPPKAALKSQRVPKSEPVTKPNALRPEAKTPPLAKRTKPLTHEEQQRAAYDSEVLAVLREELDAGDVADSDAKIRRRLLEKSLGAFEPARVTALRRFKDELQSELSSGPQSGHFAGNHGLYANPEDFDHARLIRDYTRSYPSLSPEAIAGFVPLAVYFYYLR